MNEREIVSSWNRVQKVREKEFRKSRLDIEEDERKRDGATQCGGVYECMWV